MMGRGLVVVVVGVLGARAAAADNGVVIESYTGARPDNAGRLLGPVLEELTTRGFTVGYDGIGRKFEGEVSRSARTAAGMPGDFADSVDSGHKAWIAGRYDEAVSILSPLIETAHGNAAALTRSAWEFSNGAAVGLLPSTRSALFVPAALARLTVFSEAVLSVTVTFAKS